MNVTIYRAEAMARTLKIQRFGSSLGVILPEDVLAHLGAEEGDELLLLPTQNGWRMIRADEKFRRTMKHAEDCMHRYHDTLRNLSQ